MTREQWHLFTRGCGGGWMGLWLLTDFDEARSHAVSGQGGGTYYLPDGRTGWYETTAKGLQARSGPGRTVVNELPWSLIREWSKDATDATRAKAAKLRAESRRIQDTWVSWKASPEAQGCGIHRGIGPMTRAQALQAAEWQTWNRDHAEPFRAAKNAHDDHVTAFLASLGPSDEPADLLELLAAQGSA